ncbi:MAG: tetratricopeptide repeat protein [Polyangiales bacterium]
MTGDRSLGSVGRSLDRLLGALLVAGAAATMSACVPSSRLPEGVDPEKVSRSEYDLAQDEWRNGRLRSAMDHAMKASNADENHAEAHHFVAILYLAVCQIENDCRFDKAEEFCRKSIAADSEYRPARHTLGIVLLHEKKYDEAIAVLRLLAEDIIYKTPELAWYDLGGAYLAKGDTDKAIDALHRALALKPDFCWANYRLGLAFEAKGDLAKAQEELSHAVEPKDPACHNLQDAYEARGRIRGRTGQKILARQDYEMCVKISLATPAGKSCAAML